MVSKEKYIPILAITILAISAVLSFMNILTIPMITHRLFKFQGIYLCLHLCLLLMIHVFYFYRLSSTGRSYFLKNSRFITLFLFLISCYIGTLLIDNIFLSYIFFQLNHFFNVVLILQVIYLIAHKVPESKNYHSYICAFLFLLLIGFFIKNPYLTHPLQANTFLLVMNILSVGLYYLGDYYINKNKILEPN